MAERLLMGIVTPVNPSSERSPQGLPGSHDNVAGDRFGRTSPKNVSGI